MSDVFEPGWGVGGRIRRGDEDAAPFFESVNTPPTMCLMVDSANRVVWTGHKDGKIRSWKMDQVSEDTPFKEGLSWQAHRGPVLCLTISSYGNFTSSNNQFLFPENLATKWKDSCLPFQLSPISTLIAFNLLEFFIF